MKGLRAEKATHEEVAWLENEMLCKRYGWPLEYVKSLSVLDRNRIYGVIEAENEFARMEAEKRKQLGKRGRRR